MESVQTGLRLEKRLLKVLKGLGEHLDMSLGYLVELMALNAFEGKVPFSAETCAKIEKLKAVYNLDLTAADRPLAEQLSRPWNRSEGARPKADKEELKGGEETEAVPSIDNDDGESQPTFKIKLNHTYYKMGFINPGASVDRYLGDHGDKLIVYLGSKSKPVITRINRTANGYNRVRVQRNLGPIAEFFQENFRLGEVVTAKVLDRQHIILLRPDLELAATVSDA